MLVASILLLALLAEQVDDPVNESEYRREIQELNEQALNEIRASAFREAHKHLREAEEKGQKLRPGKTNDALLAQTYVGLGAAEVLRASTPAFADTRGAARARALRHFGKAKCLAPGVKLAKIVARADVRKVFNEAKSSQSWFVSDDGEMWPLDESAPRPVPDPAAAPDPALPTAIPALTCPLLDDVAEGQSFVVRCAVNPRLGVAKVTAFYEGQRGKLSSELRRASSGWWKTTIPAKSVTGTWLRFHFEAADAAGRTCIRDSYHA